MNNTKILFTEYCGWNSIHKKNKNGKVEIVRIQNKNQFV